MRCGNERERTIWQFVICKKQMNVSFSCVCPVIDRKFRHNIVKVAVDPRGDSSLWIHSVIASWIHSYFDNVKTKFMINYRTAAWKTDINLLTVIVKRPAAQHKWFINGLLHKALCAFKIQNDLTIANDLTAAFSWPKRLFLYGFILSI